MSDIGWPSVLRILRDSASIDDLVWRIAAAFAASPEVALARIWLVGPGDQCRDCAFRETCPDRARCLHLVASRGSARVPGADHDRTDGGMRRVPIGVRKIGLIARSRRPLVAAGLRGTEAWVVDRSWLEAEGVRTFAGFPLEDEGRLLGVLGLFDRRVLDGGLMADLVQMVSDLGCAVGVGLRMEKASRELRALEREASVAHDVAASLPAGPALVGASSAFRRTLEQVAVAAGSDAPVLVVGEPGSGLTAVSAAIHARSRRREQPLFRIECGFPLHEIETRLFGGAPGLLDLPSTPGLLAIARRATIVLDNLERLAPPLQDRLATWLDPRLVPGGDAGRPRLVATIADDPARAVAGRVSSQLLDRLTIVRVEVPPVRNREDDVVALARHLATVVAQGLGREAPRLTPAAIDWIRSHPWLGNVAELHAVLERAVRVSDDSIAPDALTLPPPAAETAPTAATPLLTRAQLRRRERQNIAAALAATGGRVSGAGGAAELLGMKPTTLASRIKALGVTAQRRRRSR